jgi:IS4 transposase
MPKQPKTIDAAARKAIRDELKALRSMRRLTIADFTAGRATLRKCIADSNRALAKLDKQQARDLSAIDRRISIATARL